MPDVDMYPFASNTCVVPMYEPTKQWPIRHSIAFRSTSPCTYYTGKHSNVTIYIYNTVYFYNEVLFIFSIYYIFLIYYLRFPQFVHMYTFFLFIFRYKKLNKLLYCYMKSFLVIIHKYFERDNINNYVLCY